MVVIYTMDSTYIRNDIDDAKSIISSLYGEKLGREAYDVLKNAPVNTIFQKHGGPRIQLVTKERARWIEEKEKQIGFM